MLAIPAGAGCGLNLVALGPISWGWERGCGPVDVRLDDACPWPNGPRPWPGIFTASPADVTSRSSCPGGLPEAKKPGQQSSFWPCTSCLTVMIKPAAEGGGQPTRGRGFPARDGRWPLPRGSPSRPGPHQTSWPPGLCIHMPCRSSRWSLHCQMRAKFVCDAALERFRSQKPG